MRPGNEWRLFGFLAVTLMINLSKAIHHLANNYRVSYDSHGSLGGRALCCTFQTSQYLTNPKIKRKQLSALSLKTKK